MKRETAQMALEALKDAEHGYQAMGWRSSMIDEAIAAIEADLAQPVKPFAWATSQSSRMWKGEFAEPDAKQEARLCGGDCRAYPLYTAPPEPAVNAELLEALQAILPFIPKSTSNDGGAAALSTHIQAADKVRAAIAKAGGAT